MNKRKEHNLVSGKLRMARNGAGFIVDEKTGEAIWIEEGDLGTALPDDIVSVRIRERRSRRSGKDGVNAVIVDIAQRAQRMIVGTVSAIGRFVRVQPLSPTFRREFTVPDAKNAAVGDRVVMRFVRWRSAHLAPEGEIEEIIGPADLPSLDTKAIMKQYDLPEEFPEEALREAELVSELKEGNRLDLRKKFIFTCDPASARDFDDALSLETDSSGRRVLGVHIADVSHYVRPGTALDREAYRRSTSVYLVDKVVPMLPEQLSNGVCSLVPGEDRPAFSVFLTYDDHGRCVGRKFAKSLIRSKARFTYEQVMEELKSGKSRKSGKFAVLKQLNELAQQMRKRRFAEGALDMDVPEAELQLDADGMMTGAVMRPYDESHQLIEECMVAANEAVAMELWTRGVKILTRLHEPPDPEKLEELRATLMKLGINCGNLSKDGALSAFLHKIKGSPLEGTLSVMALRSMKRAVYSAERIGHFGLAKKYYAHFTSPIRRYPDLVLHRQLASFLNGRGGRVDFNWLKNAAKHCSEKETIADDAERSLAEIKKFRFLASVIGDDVRNRFNAVIAKCTRHGVFIDIPDFAIGGMVHISKLTDDYVRWNEFEETLSGGGRTWKAGDRMEVRVLTVDFNRRLADFVPIVESARAAHGGTRRRGRRSR